MNIIPNQNFIPHHSHHDQQQQQRSQRSVPEFEATLNAMKCALRIVGLQVSGLFLNFFLIYWFLAFTIRFKFSTTTKNYKKCKFQSRQMMMMMIRTISLTSHSFLF